MLPQAPPSKFGYWTEGFLTVFIYLLINFFFPLSAGLSTWVFFMVSEAVSQLSRKKEVTWLFYFCAAMVVVFVPVEIYFQQSFLHRYEAAITNFLAFALLGLSLKFKKTLVQDFREKRIEWYPITIERIAYHRLVTKVWTVYLGLRTLGYVWIAYDVTVNHKTLSIVLGRATLYPLLFATLLVSKRFRPQLKRLGLV